MLHKLAEITEVNEPNISEFTSTSLFDAVVLNTCFPKSAIGNASLLSESDSYFPATYQLIDFCCSQLVDGGIMFIYGLPNYLLSLIHI